MNCKNCASMEQLSLPTCRQEVIALAYRDCDAPAGPGAFVEFLDNRFPANHSDRDFPGHWAQLAHVRREHLEFHRQRGGSCPRINELLAEQKSRAAR